MSVAFTDSRFPTPDSRLPPAARDFEIHRLALVEFLSTRRITEKYEISQTRVRQIIARVADWLTEMLPVKSEADMEKEKRYAIHLAAAQLQHQIEHLQIFWDATSDPKYYRQQARAILALARLGVSSHHLDSLAANYSDDPLPTQARSASEGPSSQPVTHPTAASTSLTPPLSHSSASTSSFSIHPSAFASPPPSEDCSPQTPQAFSLASSASPTPDATSSPAIDLLRNPELIKDTLKGLDIMERNLLSYVDQISPSETERLQHLHESLADLRQSRANYILQLGPNAPIFTASNTDQPSPFPVGEG
jgi:hypothetical protein